MKKENLNEEIERIKALFSEERLYGNLINEQPYATDINSDGNIDTDEAIEFLNTQGYLIKQETESDFCIGKAGPLNIPYKYLKDNYGRAFEGMFSLTLTNKSGVCRLGIKKAGLSGKFYILNLYADESSNSGSGPIKGRFNMFYKPNNATENRGGVIVSKDSCVKENWPISPYNLVWTGPGFNIDLPNTLITIGVHYIKVEGDFTCKRDGTELNLSNANVVGIMNKDLKGIKSNFSYTNPANGNKATVDLSALGFDSVNGGGAQIWTDDGGTTCYSTIDYVQRVLGWNLSDAKSINDILDKIG
jgi:hypothetical protein